MNNKNNTIFYIFISAIFLIITAPALFSEGMVMDGVLYASISRNMANGLGTFWKPYLAQYFNAEFYGHPPLALGLQSLWFRVFGDSIFVERFYSLFTYFVMGVVIVAIWKQFTNSYKTGWIPLLFYYSMLKISWACANNMLENTMSVFIGLSILFYLKSINKHKIFFLILSGLFLFAATLTKGFVGLYVWGFPFFYWLFNRNQQFGRIALDTFVLITLTILPFVMLFFYWPAANIYMMNYYNQQILSSIQNIASVDNRFFIVIAVIYHAIPPLLIGLLILIISKFKKIKLKLISTNYRLICTLLLLAIGGVLPITISMKQSGHYAITVYPYIALAIGLTLYPLIIEMIEKIDFNSIKFRVFSYFTYLTAFFAIVFSCAQVGKLRYEKERVSDCKLIIQEIGKDKTISICPEMFVEWSLHGYFARYGNVSLDANNYPSQEYLITDVTCANLNITQNYKEIIINTKDYKLYKRE